MFYAHTLEQFEMVLWQIIYIKIESRTKNKND